MAKEFKDFDKMFSKAEIEACRKQYLHGASKSDLALYNRWMILPDYWTNAEIREAVYFMEDSKRWQLFRVSMKGCTTQEKLYMLHNYYTTHDAQTVAREKLRVDNYIGALVRGGQLSVSDLRVLK